MNERSFRYLYTYFRVLVVTSRMIMTAARLLYSNTTAVNVRCNAVDHWTTDTYETVIRGQKPK